MEEKIVQSLKKMLPISQIEDKRNVLCILPHPDDGEMGAGGTIAKLKSGFKDYLSNGYRGRSWN